MSSHSNQPEQVYELSVRYNVHFEDQGFIPYRFVIGLFKKESDVLRVMRVIRANNTEHLQFSIDVITNPYLITQQLSDKTKIY